MRRVPHDAVYDSIGHGYATIRRSDPRLERRIHAALGDARTVVNVGAGTGSYEPRDRHVVAIEPSAVMRAQRPRDLAPAIDATAERLPLDDDAVDAAMAVITIHHWAKRAAGLAELRRVARGPVVVVTFDIDVAAEVWLPRDYLPEVTERDRERFPPPAEVAEALGGARIDVLAIPADCRDGFFHAYLTRPEAYLDRAVRAAQSVWPPLPDGVEERAVGALAADLESGAWDQRHGAWRAKEEYDAGLRLVVSDG